MNNSSSILKYNDIEKEIYKILSKPEYRKTIKISDLLKQFPIRKTLDLRLIYPREAMIKSLILMNLKGIKSQTELSKFLTENEEDAFGLGFLRDSNNKILIPNQRTLSHFINHVLTNSEKKLIELIVRHTKAITEKTGIVFSDEVFETKKIGSTSNKYELQYKTENERKKIYKLAKKIILPSLKFPYMRHNCKYKLPKFLGLLIHMSLQRGFAESEAEVFLNKLEGRELPKKSPKGETLLYHIKKYEDGIESMQNMFINIFEKTYKQAKKRTNLFDRRKVTVAIDHTELRFFGKQNNKMVITRMGDFRGTKWGFRFITISIVDRGRKYILLTLPLGRLSNEYKAVEKLIEFAKEKVNINVLIADRHFSQDTEFIRLFERLGVKYVMIAKKTSKIKKGLKRLTPPFYLKKFDYQGIKTNLIVIKGRKEEHIPFITNMKLSINTNNGLLFWGHRIDEIYGKRWSIETAFSDIKKFLAKTTSKRYSIRLFYFLLSTTLYNLWILGESLLSLFLYGRVLKKTSIKALIFIHGILSEFLVT